PGLIAALGSRETARAMLDEVFRWTDGHPYMTQRLCEELCGSPALRRSVEAAVADLFLRRGRLEDANLAWAEKQFDVDRGAPLAGEMLQLYGRLWRGDRIAASDDEVQRALRLTGMAAERRDDRGPLLR